MIELKCGVCGESYTWPAILGYSPECECGALQPLFPSGKPVPKEYYAESPEAPV